MSTKLDFIDQDLTNLREQGLFIDIRVLDSPQGAWITVDGKKVLNLCSNNYLGFANHPVHAPPRAAVATGAKGGAKVL